MTTPTTPQAAHSEMAAFLNGMRDLILTETAAQRRQIHAQWAKPLPAPISVVSMISSADVH